MRASDGATVRRQAHRRAASRAQETRAGYHHGALPEALVQAAVAILREEGLEKLTLRETARRAGVSHAAPAHHFKDIGGLLSDVAAYGFDSLRALMERKQARAGADAKLKLRAVGAAYIEYALANRALFQLMFRSDRVNAGSERLKSAAAATFGVLQESLRAAGQAGAASSGIESDSARAVLAWSLVHGFATLLLEGQLARFQGKLGTARFARKMGSKILSMLRPVLAGRVQ
jgi:AcrR family transcriptional regulator